MNKKEIQKIILKEWENFKKTDGFDKTMWKCEQACIFEEYFKETNNNLILEYNSFTIEDYKDFYEKIIDLMNSIKNGFNIFFIEEIKQDETEFNYFLVKEK